MSDTTTNGSFAVDGTESTFTATTADYTLTPDEEALVAGIEDLDPIDSIPSPVVATGDTSRFAIVPPVTTLPPALQEYVRQQLVGIPQERLAEAERGAILVAMRKNALELRVKQGAGPGATPYARELLDISRAIYDLEREFDSITAKLAEVDRYETDTDPVTGAASPRPVYAVDGQSRRALEQRLAQITYEISLKDGEEGRRRLAKAKKETAEFLKAQRDQLAEDAEARAMAEQMNREARIKAKAELYAKHNRHNLS